MSKQNPALKSESKFYNSGEKKAVFTMQCCITNHSKTFSLEDQTFIMSQFLWIRNLGLFQLGGTDSAFLMGQNVGWHLTGPGGSAGESLKGCDKRTQFLATILRRPQLLIVTLGLLEYPHDITSGFSENEWSERESKTEATMPQCPSCPNLRCCFFLSQRENRVS